MIEPVPDPPRDVPPPPKPLLPQYIVRYIAAAVTLLLFIGLFGGAVRSHDVCVGQNEVRDVVRNYLSGQLEQSKEANFHQLFPTVAKDRLHVLKQRSLTALRTSIHQLADKNCGYGF